MSIRLENLESKDEINEAIAVGRLIQKGAMRTNLPHVAIIM
jgi:hypothetical protein